MKPLPRLLRCWVEKRIKEKEKERLRALFFSLRVCLLCCKCYTLKAMLNFYSFCVQNVFLVYLVMHYFVLVSLQCIFCCVISSGLPPCSVCGWFCSRCGVKVMFRSWTLPRGDRGVGKELCAVGYTTYLLNCNSALHRQL